MAGPPYRSAADRASAEAFFKGRPAARATFEEVRRFMAACGPMEMASTKSRVAFVAGTRFHWVHEAHLDGTITMGFLLPRRVDSPRLRSGAVGGRWSHHVKLARLDPELEAWFREAYEWDRQAIQETAPKVRRPKAYARAKATPKARVGGEVADWTCPACGQSFTRRNQSHSCARQEMEELFEDYPAAVAVARAVHRHLATLGPVEMAAAKTQLSFRHRVRFAWVWMPRQSAGSGPDTPVVSFGLRRKLSSGRVWRAVIARGDFWTHHVLVPRARDVDAELKAWLAEAFETVGPGARGAA